MLRPVRLPQHPAGGFEPKRSRPRLEGLEGKRPSSSHAHAFFPWSLCARDLCPSKMSSGVCDPDRAVLGVPSFGMHCCSCRASCAVLAPRGRTCKRGTWWALCLLDHAALAALPLFSFFFFFWFFFFFGPLPHCRWRLSSLLSRSIRKADNWDPCPLAREAACVVSQALNAAVCFSSTRNDFVLSSHGLMHGTSWFTLEKESTQEV